ncbi:hypothetical protein AX769_21350 (plasmid) [Frondihabitans sp. PAMC 28766]|nr:hypothetical protein AX769_21350 [Frondihabitans sp. PAMC 28766]
MTLWRMTVPISHATAQIATTPTTDKAPRVLSNTGTMMSRPEPRIDANGVTEATTMARRRTGFLGAVMF